MTQPEMPCECAGRTGCSGLTYILVGVVVINPCVALCLHHDIEEAVRG